ncbi:MAG: riboflavin synthase, partial [Bacteroidota bacterium]
IFINYLINMFTGIIESISVVKSIHKNGTNMEFGFECPFVSELKIDQSLSHNGVCLTVTGIENGIYNVTAISETLDRTNLGRLAIGDTVNVERCMLMGGRLDGHIVQGHVDTVAKCESISDMDGSWLYRFSFPEQESNLIVEKGSVCINGVSLTVVDASNGIFSVAIIPYTYENTNFKDLKPGDLVNLEFDVIGKYVAKMLGRALT